MYNLLGNNVTSERATPAFYSVTPAQIAISGTGTQTLITDGDSIFKLFYFQGTSDLDTNSLISPNNFSVRIRLNNGRLITNDYIQQRIICPTQQYVLPEPCQIEFPGNTQFQFDFLNLSGASVINIQFVLHGVKIYE